MATLLMILCTCSLAEERLQQCRWRQGHEARLELGALEAIILIYRWRFVVSNISVGRTAHLVLRALPSLNPNPTLSLVHSIYMTSA